MSDTPDTLLSALLAVQKELPSISLEKTGKGQIGSRDYKYLDLAGLHNKILPLLTQHGLVWTTMLSGNAQEPHLRYSLTHAATGEAITGSAPMMLDKPTSQALGSATTYLRRYCLLSVIGAVGDSDDDGAKASIPRSEQQTEQIQPQTRKGDEPDRPLNNEEKSLVLKAMSGHADKDMLLRSVGCDDLDALTVSQGRAIMKKVGTPSK